MLFISFKTRPNFLLLGCIFLAFFSACTNSANSASESDDEGLVAFSDDTAQKIYNITDKRVQDPARALKELFGYLRNEEPIYRLLAAQGLANIADTATATVDTLAKVLQKDSSPQVRQAVAFALGTTGNLKAATVLAASFQPETNMAVRATILEAVGKTGNVDMLNFIAGVQTYQAADSSLLEAQSRSIFRFSQRGAK